MNKKSVIKIVAVCGIISFSVPLFSMRLSGCAVGEKFVDGAEWLGLLTKHSNDDGTHGKQFVDCAGFMRAVDDHRNRVQVVDCHYQDSRRCGGHLSVPFKTKQGDYYDHVFPLRKDLINGVDTRGNTLLMYASVYPTVTVKRELLVHFLTRRGADPLVIKSSNNMTPIILLLMSWRAKLAFRKKSLQSGKLILDSFEDRKECYRRYSSSLLKLIACCKQLHEVDKNEAYWIAEENFVHPALKGLDERFKELDFIVTQQLRDYFGIKRKNEFALMLEEAGARVPKKMSFWN